MCGRRDDRRPLGQRPVGRRLLLEDVQRGAADLSAVERRGKGRIVDQLAAGRVDDADALLRLGKALGVDHVPRLRRHRQMQGEVVGRGKDFVERAELGADLRSQLRRDERVVRDDLHLEGSRAGGDLLSDAAEADDAERLAAELAAGKLLLLPLVRLHRRVGRRQMARQREQLAHRQLRDADAVGARRVHHDDAACAGGVQVDVVHARAGARDHAQRRRGGDDLASHLRRAAHDQRVGVGDGGQQFGQRPAGGRIDDPSVLLGEQGNSGPRQIIGNHNFHRRTLENVASESADQEDEVA